MTSGAVKLTAGRAIVAQFHKSAGGRLSLWSVVAIEERGDYLYRTYYDVEQSRVYGYIFHQSGAGGSGPVSVDGIYFVSGEVRTKEGPCQLVDARDEPPWRGKRTRTIRLRNRTRRLRTLPKAFDLQPGWDLLDWLRGNAIDSHAVYCSECRDSTPDNSLCEHCWWCDKTGWYSTPSERCKCKDHEECSDDRPAGRSALGKDGG